MIKGKSIYYFSLKNEEEFFLNPKKFNQLSFVKTPKLSNYYDFDFPAFEVVFMIMLKCLYQTELLNFFFSIFIISDRIPQVFFHGLNRKKFNGCITNNINIYFFSSFRVGYLLGN